MTLEEVERRVKEALRADKPTWLEDALSIIEAYMGTRHKQRSYDVSTVGLRIRVAREAAGMGQRELARRINLSQATLSHIEGGTRPLPATKIYPICFVTGVKRPWLLMESEEGGPPNRVGLLRSKPVPKPSALTKERKKREARRIAMEMNAANRIRREHVARSMQQAANGGSQEPDPHSGRDG